MATANDVLLKYIHGEASLLKVFAMKKILQLFIGWLVLCGMFSSCSDKKGTKANWLDDYKLFVAVDESFRPIMEEELNTYALKYPETTLVPTYCSEDSAFRLLKADSVKMIIATRGLSEAEKAYFKQHTYVPTQMVIGYDALSLIVNKASADTLITLDEIKGIVSGRITRWEQLAHHQQKGELRLVFDHSGSSTVRYMRDSLNGGKPLSGNLFAQGDNKAVIEAVKADPTIIGVVGTDWLKKQGTAALSSFASLDVKTMMVSYFSGADEDFFRPYQYYIATGQYPLVRSVYVIETDPRSSSPTKNFYFFLKGQNGQTILLNQSQMLPYKRVQVKNVSIKK